MLSWQDSYIRKMTYKPSKLGQTNTVFGLWSEFINRSIRTESPHATVIIWATLVNAQTQMQRAFFTSYTISSASQPAEKVIDHELNHCAHCV